MTTLTLYLAMAAAVLLLALAFVFVRLRYWIAEGRKIQKPGYTTPQVTIWARAIRAILGYFIVRLRVGRLTVIGRKNLRFAARLLITPNHQIEKDAVLMPAVLGRLNFRFLMAITQMTGIRAPLAAWLGGIAVHHDKNPGAAVKATIGALKNDEDSSLVVFPQGALKRDNVLRREEFFAGVIMIGKHVAKKSKLPFALVPTGIYYDRDPKHATLLFRLARAFGIGWFSNWFNETTYGATIVFGQPILLSDLPDDLEKATDVLFQEVSRLSAFAESYTRRRLV